MRRREFLSSLAVAGGALHAQAPAGPPIKRAAITSSIMIGTLPGTFEQQLELVGRAGLQSIELTGEHLGWSEAQARDAQRRLRSLRIGIDALLANRDGNKSAMVRPEQHDTFLAEVRTALSWAQRLDVPHIIVMSGNDTGAPREQQYAAMVEAGKRAAEVAATAAKTLIVEPLNTKVDHKGYYLNTAAEGVKLVQEVDSPHFRLLFDAYHEATEGGDPVKALATALPYTNVIHVADTPGRHEPGTGTMDWPGIYKAIAKGGYQGIVCLEYLPTKLPVESLIQSVTTLRYGLTGQV